MSTERDYYRRLGERIRTARNAKGWTQLRTGMELGLSSVAIHHWEHGHTRPTLWHIYQLEKVLGKEIRL